VRAAPPLICRRIAKVEGVEFDEYINKRLGGLRTSQDDALHARLAGAMLMEAVLAADSSALADLDAEWRVLKAVTNAGAALHNAANAQHNNM
jgi:hypothetical protein